MAFVAFGLCCPQGLEQGLQDTGVLSLGCDTVSGVLALGAGGPGCPQEVLAGKDPKIWLKSRKSSFPGHSQVIFGIKQLCCLHPHDNVSVLVTGQSLLLLQCWVALGHGRWHGGGRAVMGAGGSRACRERLQQKLCLTWGHQGELPGSDPFRDHGIVECLGWKNPLRALSPTVPWHCQGRVPKCHIHRWHALVL